MTNLIPSFEDITNWPQMPYYQTGGTRDKCIVQNPNSNELFYFKTSLKKEVIDYKYEFWSEIIASKIGQFFQFRMLDYNIAFKNNAIGCISKSMANEYIELTEGKQFLMGTDNHYKPEDKTSYDKYTFQFIEEALKQYKLQHYLSDLIETIIFDSLIGNGDRHQENWGFIVNRKEKAKALASNSRAQRESAIKKMKQHLLSINKKAEPQIKLNTIDTLIEFSYSPIYDSGSCLGREIADEKVDDFLRDSKRLESYINKGKSEIHWKGSKVQHFELIQNINRIESYEGVIKRKVAQVEQLMNEQSIRDIVFKIDDNLPKNLNQFKMPEERKKLIIKIVILRFRKLMEIIQ